MARLDSPPNWGMVGRLKPPLDLYLWKGIWCARVYPLHINQPGTPAQKATWDAMNAAIDGWDDLQKIDRVAWTRFVRRSHRTGKDFYYRIHLKGQTNPANQWCQTKLTSYGPWIIGYRVVLSTDKNCSLTLRYCFDKEQEDAWGWLKMGYCIRGRRMVRKRKLWERWPRTAAQVEPGETKTHTFTIPPGGGWSQLYFTTQSCDSMLVNYRGRTGAYSFERTEVYP